MSPPTINLKAPTGIWRPVFAHRAALHATASATVLAAWRGDVKGIALGPALAAWRSSVGPADSEADRRLGAASAVLAVLAPQPWARTRVTLALVAQRAHRVGWLAGRAIATRDRTDDTDLDDDDGDDPGLSVAPADLSNQLADHTAAATLAAAVAALSRRIARQAADDSSDGEGLDDLLDEGDDVDLATDTAVSAAFGAGLLAAYMSLGAQSLQWTTAGDERVCEACLSAEANSPYSPFAAPGLPAHPRCRCIFAPT